MQTILTTGILLITTCAAFAQSTPPARTFEVASIKPAAPPTDGFLMVRMGGDAGRLDYVNVSLKDLIRNAFKIKDRQIEGPDWLGSERYDVKAKFPEGATKDDVPAMLQALLVERFKLTYHKRSKVMPIYALVPAKGGPKLKPADASGNLRMMMAPKGIHMTGKVPLAQLSDSLSNFTDRLVVDMTELKGIYDIDLEFKPEGRGPGGPGMMRMGPPGGGPGGAGPGPGPGEAGQPHDDAEAASLFTAIQEKLGLKLDPQKTPVDLYVIDHVEKTPSEN